MWILIDFDNLDRLHIERGIRYAVENIVDRLDEEDLIHTDRVQFRLYGGWYLGDELSKRATELLIEVEDVFPSIFGERVGGKPPLILSVHLAKSLLADPKRDLFHTYRPRGFPGGLSTYDPPFEGCSEPLDCPTASLCDFFTNRECTKNGCYVHPKRVINRAEQKMVDTMLVADLFHLVREEQNTEIAVVSSDDDLWPGIRVALDFGRKIYHIHTRIGQSTPDHYKLGLPKNYFSLERN